MKYVILSNLLYKAVLLSFDQNWKLVALVSDWLSEGS